MQELKLPELGEGVESAEVAAVLVSVGDVIDGDQPVIEVETEKASLEVPASVAGKVTEVMVARGDTVSVGQAILKIEAQAEAAAGADEQPVATASEKDPVNETRKNETEEPRRHETPRDEDVIDFPRKEQPSRVIGATVPAAPSVRALARELGVDILQVSGSGPGGRLTRDDVKAHAKSLIRRSTGAAGVPTVPELPDFGKWGEVEREQLTAVRRRTAAAMATAWSQIPHVTQFDRSDVTQLDAMRRKFNQRPEAEGRKLTMTAIVIKIAALALRQFPKFNASLDLAGDAVILKKYVNVGCAVDTERGLLVPVVRHANRKGLLEISGELADLAERARSRKIQPDELRGGTFTITNLGGLGTTYFSPIVNWPEVAILGVGRAQQQAVYEDGTFVPRAILPLSASYDHRLIDGADAARFLRWIAEALEQPLLLLLDEG